MSGEKKAEKKKSKKIIKKVVFMGPQGVGKTTLIHRLMEDLFQTDYQPTVSPQFSIHETKTHVFQFWDTSGNEMYQSFTQYYLRGADLCVLVYNIVDLVSYYDLTLWRDFYLSVQANK